MKFAVAFILVLFVFSGLYNFATNLDGKDCVEPELDNKGNPTNMNPDTCYKNYITSASLGNKKSVKSYMAG